ncbi:hypothetical protein ABIB85_008267 [Bradyrhizobium sp. JR1.5]|uniref:hypothetical protein n=1 Tax=unclassified Bradyrhizobium TaxID=2631580 RepID=UPI003396F90F
MHARLDANGIVGEDECMNVHGAALPETVVDCEYQMLHRAASAYEVARIGARRPQLAYFKFTPSMSSTSAALDYYRGRFSITVAFVAGF